MKSTESNGKSSRECRLAALLAVFLFACLISLPAGASGSACLIEEVIPLEMPCVDESKTGSAVADLWRDFFSTDVALVPGGLLGGPFPAGQQSGDTLRSILTEDVPLVTTKLTSAQLKNLLEVSVSHIVLTEEELIDREVSSFEGFLQVSGFSFLYDASAPVGQRIDEIELDSGLSLLEDGAEAVITAVLPAPMAEGVWGYPVLPLAEETGETAFSALMKQLSAQKSLSMPSERRIRIRGSSEQSIFSEYIPLWVVIPAMILLAIPRFWIRRQEREDEF